jgi:DNA-binding MarR family transcriptional regulator
MEEREQQIQIITRELRMVYKSIQAHSKIVEKKCGLSSAQLGMLHEIDTTPGMKVSQLASALTIHTSTCSNMLDKLEAKGLIRRDRQKADQRSVHLYITAAGKQVLADAPKPVQGKLTNALNNLNHDQLSALSTSLSNLISALNVPDDETGLTPIAE